MNLFTNKFNKETSAALLEYCREHKAALKSGDGKRAVEELEARGIKVTPALIATLQLTRDVSKETEELNDRFGPMAVLLVNVYALAGILVENGTIDQHWYFVQLRKQIKEFSTNQERREGVS